MVKYKFKSVIVISAVLGFVLGTTTYWLVDKVFDLIVKIELIRNGDGKENR